MFGVEGQKQRDKQPGDACLLLHTHDNITGMRKL